LTIGSHLPGVRLSIIALAPVPGNSQFSTRLRRPAKWVEMGEPSQSAF